jgi:hypothetical protein
MKIGRESNTVHIETIRLSSGWKMSDGNIRNTLNSYVNGKALLWSDTTRNYFETQMILKSFSGEILILRDLSDKFIKYKGEYYKIPKL